MMAGKPLAPVRRIQVEAVPALRAPGLADPSLLEDEVLAAALREQIARRETGLACSDHDCVDVRPGH
jgi:hypothetical protein